MPLATIQVITPTGSFSTQHGEMYSFDYTFSDGMFGSANHKSVHSPFQVGQQVEYEVTGDFQGKAKLKVKRPQQGGGYPQQRPQAQGHTHHTPNAGKPASGQGNAIYGATVGMAINQAVECLKEERGTALAEYLVTNEGGNRLHQLASVFVRLALHMEAGNLRPSSATQQTAAAPAPQPQRQQPPPRQPRQHQPDDNPTGQAFPTDDMGDEDVPF